MTSSNTSSSTKHHHRSSLKQKNKSFKNSSSTSNSKSKGKVNKTKGSSIIKNDLSKLDRKNRSAMIINNRKIALQEMQRNHKGHSGVPRICLMVPLSSETVIELPTFCEGNRKFYSSRCKQNLSFEILNRSDFPTKENWILRLLDRISIADCIIFTSTIVADGDLIDSIGHETLDIISKTGISSSIALLTQPKNLPINQKELLAKKAFFLSSLKGQIGSLAKVHLDSDQVDLERCLCNQSLTEISWRKERPFMCVDDFQYSSSDGLATMTGIIRGGGKPFHPDRLIHIPSLRKDFKIHQILYEDGNIITRTPGNDIDMCSVMDMDNNNGGDDDSIDTNTNTNDVSMLSEDEDALVISSQGVDTIDLQEHEEKRKIFLSERHFKDEIQFDLNNIAARERLQKYRGVQSLRTSTWNKLSSLPPHYSSIFHFQNPKQSKIHALKDDPFIKRTTTMSDYNGNGDGDGGDSGDDERRIPKLFYSKVSITLQLSTEEAEHLLLKEGDGFAVFGLLIHEQRMGVVNFTIDTRDKTIKNKERVLAIIGGFRHLMVEPILSEHSNNSLNKMLRSCQGIMVGSICCNISYEGSPLLLFKSNDDGEDGSLEFLSHGSVMDNDPHRIILKRITLTGLPFKVQKKSAVIRFMFGNAEDVQWFKPIELVSKCGARGHIRESLGTHGYMKCLFDRPIFHHDIVSMNLYKRVFPKPL